MILLASDLRAPRDGRDDALLRLAGETGADGIHLGGGCDLEMQPLLAAAALRTGSQVPSLALPLPERRLAPGRRLPRLTAHHRDERDAAIALALQGIEAAAPTGARVAVLDFGEVALTARAGELARAFARREMDEDDPGGRLLAGALGERRARSNELGDACRWSLERLLRVAERVGLRLALPIAATPWQVPSLREARALVDAFGGAPAGLVWDPGRLSVLAALGLAVSEERLGALAADAIVVIENDAVGIDAGILPGLGERDPRVAALAAPASAPRIVAGGPGATDAEVAAAVALCRRD